MLTGLRRSMLISAAARNLAVDLVEEHGVVALDIIDRALAIADTEPPCDGAASENERILTASRTHIVGLVGLLANARPDRRHGADIAAAAGRLRRAPLSAD